VARYLFIADNDGEQTELTQATKRKVAFRVQGSASATFELDGRHEQADAIDELVTDLDVWRVEDTGRRTKLYHGRIGRTADKVGTDAHSIEVTSADYREILGRRILFADVTKTAIDQAVIAWDLIQYTQGLSGGALGITQGIGATTGTTRTVTFEAGRTIGECIDELSNLDGGFDWEIDANLKLNIYSLERGVNNNVILDYGGLVTTVNRDLNPGDYADALRVSGSDALTAQTRTAADIATRPEGRWDKQIGTTDIVDQAVLDKAADQLLTDQQTITPAYTVKLRPGAWEGPDHIWLGDTVTLRCASGRLDINDAVRVLALEISPGESGEEDVTLTVAARPRNLMAELASHAHRLRRLERR
jgi:hypothetical protein